MNRKPRPVLMIGVERKDYQRSYTLTITRPPNRSYTLQAERLQDVLEFVKLMSPGLYGVSVCTGFVGEDAQIEAEIAAIGLRLEPAAG